MQKKIIWPRLHSKMHTIRSDGGQLTDHSFSVSRSTEKQEVSTDKQMPAHPEQIVRVNTSCPDKDNIPLLQVLSVPSLHRNTIPDARLQHRNHFRDIFLSVP